MNKNELHSQINTLLQRLVANNNNLKDHTGRFPQLETDLLRKQCIELYDLINQLHLANVADKQIYQANEIIMEPVQIKEPEKAWEPEKTEPEITGSNEIIEQEEPAEILPPVIKEAPAPEIVENNTPDIEEEIVQPTVLNTPRFVPVIEKPAPVYVAPPIKAVMEEKSVLEKISEDKAKTTLYDAINTNREEKELAHNFANSRISSIKNAIDISKRFELQSNLFLADSQSYVQAINELENAGNKTTALEIFDRFSKRFHWNSENELVQELKSFIYRKY